MSSSTKKTTVAQLYKLLLKLPVEERRRLVQAHLRRQEFKLVKGGRYEQHPR